MYEIPTLKHQSKDVKKIRNHQKNYDKNMKSLEFLYFIKEISNFLQKINSLFFFSFNDEEIEDLCKYSLPKKKYKRKELEK